MRNYYIFAGLLVVFCLFLIARGFMIVGSPFEQKALQMDNQRMKDFSDIVQEISSYYSSKNKLPKKLSDLEETKTYYTTTLVLKDPDTKEEYRYETQGKAAYKLCTMFSTDSTSENKKDKKNKSRYYDTYYLEKYTKNTNHKKGYDCLSFDLSDYYGLNTTPTPTPEPSPVFSHQNPIKYLQPSYNQILCLGSDAVIEWEVYSPVKRLTLYIITPVGLESPLYGDPPNPDLYKGKGIPTGEISDPTNPASPRHGTFIWQVGKVTGHDGQLLTLKPGYGYSLGADTAISLDGYTPKLSEYFEISDCSGDTSGKNAKNSTQ